MENLQRRAPSGFQGSMCKTQTDFRTEAVTGSVGAGALGPPREVFVCVMFRCLFQKKSPPVRFTEPSSHSPTFLSILLPVESHYSRPHT